MLFEDEILLSDNKLHWWSITLDRQIDYDGDYTLFDGYLSKVVSNAMLSVLKSSGRITRNAQGYKSTAPSVSLENPLDNGFVDITDPAISFVDKIDEEETISEIYECILKFDRQEPEQKFGLIFYMKYVEGKKQREIAETLGISQGEVSKRLFDLMQKISKEIA